MKQLLEIGLQIGGYSLALLCIGKHMLTLLFIGLVTLFGGLICWNLGWLS